MTHEEIDKLEGRELDAAFAEAFQAECIWKYHKATDRALAALPDEWEKSIGGGGSSGWTAVIHLSKKFKGHGPTPATALCRAALKAKGEEQTRPTKAESTPGGIIYPPDVVPERLSDDTLTALARWALTKTSSAGAGGAIIRLIAEVHEWRAKAAAAPAGPVITADEARVQRTRRNGSRRGIGARQATRRRTGVASVG